LWQDALGEKAPLFDGALDGISSQFTLSARTIHVQGAQLEPVAAETAQLEGLMWSTCREMGRSKLDDLAQRIEATAGWDDLILPAAQKATLHEIGAHVKNRLKVHLQWGFAGKGTRGLGVTALFAGESGTGKTLAAEVLAGELGLDLYRIDLASVVSKYIGETEKNLRNVFDVAEESGAILLFDEADALFGKRSEVKDSHDRYANIEVSYLLQRMESYRGLAILTTNMQGSLDPAFLRRLRFVVAFPFPDESERVELWRRSFPVATPTNGLDFAVLAQLQVSGGSIRNVALASAFLAASEDSPVRMAHVHQAALDECTKQGKAIVPSELDGWLA
jgi:SpoVK/Ycf46/Vps4 family AAA+-type ATPase